MVLLFVVAYAVPVVLVGRGSSSPGVLLAWLAVPEAVRVAWQAFRDRGQDLNRTLARTARHLLLFSLLLAGGLIMGRL